MLPWSTHLETMTVLNRVADKSSSKRRAGPFLLIAAVLALLTPHALACGFHDGNDRERELASIRNRLLGDGLEPKVRTEVARLLEIASVNPRSLGIRGVRLQAKARGDALKLLGRPRIPAWPSQEFDDINAKLKKPLDESVRKKGAALRDEAQKLWRQEDYSKARAVLGEAVKLLGIKIFHWRCGSF